MNLSQDILKGVNLLGDSKQIPDASFKEITDVAFGVILGTNSEDRLLDNNKADIILIKQAYSALVSLLLESAKLNIDPLVLKGVLEEEKVDDKRIDYLTTIYGDKKAQIRVKLSTVGFNFPRLIDSDWRLDYFIKSNSLEKANTPVYFVSLKTKDNRETSNEYDEETVDEDEMKSKALKTIDFSCSIEQMQDLVTKLKDAVKQVERSANS